MSTQKVTPFFSKKIKYYKNNLYVFNILMIRKLNYVLYLVIRTLFPACYQTDCIDFSPYRACPARPENSRYPFFHEGIQCVCRDLYTDLSKSNLPGRGNRFMEEYRTLGGVMEPEAWDLQNHVLRIFLEEDRRS